MGNWRTVQMEGSVDEAEIPALQAACHFDLERSDEDGPEYHCLMETYSLCGLNFWIKPTIQALGNLAERDYTVEDVARTLERLAQIAPSLTLTVHCGGDWEDKACVATITVRNGIVAIGPLEVEQLDEMSDYQMTLNMMEALANARRR